MECSKKGSIPVPPQVLIKDKYLSEFKTEYEKALARKNLGITGTGGGSGFMNWVYLED